MSYRNTFENELAQLRENVAYMAKKVEKSYENLFNALENRREEDIFNLIESDKDVSKRQREIESQCLFLITKQQPVIGDLRVVTAALKVVTDIERVGDHVSDMAELMLRLKMKDLSFYSVHLKPMILATKEMIHDAVSVFTQRNLTGAGAVINADDIIDECFNKVKEEIILSLKKEVKDADECIDALMLAKYLEKIGDHAVNIAQWEIFQETGNMDNIRLL